MCSSMEKDVIRDGQKMIPPIIDRFYLCARMLKINKYFLIFKLRECGII